MDTRELLDVLGYSSSPNCLTGHDLRHAPDYGHVFRRAEGGAGLKAVYCLRSPVSESRATGDIVPVSYVCKATSFEHADEIHRLVWNQNVVPFLIVLAPQGVRVYTGFERQTPAGTRQHLIHSELADATSRLAGISSSSIDSGTVWDSLGERIRPHSRVEWRLLDDLAALEQTLIADGLRDSTLVHTLIGKLLYLHYLRDRDILSDARLAKWNLTWAEVASRHARVKSFVRLCKHLDEWLNGSVFPLGKSAISDIGANHLQRAAGIFSGDSATGQQHLAFDAYNFSYIPIETLSVVYEQFLHLRPIPSGGSAGRKQGAYYTPLPVVNFIIDRMDEVKPLRPGMRVLDPSCGSGAFLVQCYRKLIEDTLRSSSTQKLRPAELRELLVRHIFGVDVDAEACRIAELSLLLTMLDYIDPPDLTNTSFKLPDLSGTNIVKGNAFDDSEPLIAGAKIRGFDWIVGNPPWNEPSADTEDPADQPVMKWIRTHKTDKPTGGHQTAEPFAWRAQELGNRDGLAGLLVPAMVLFKNESRAFRERFFATTQMVYVANFSNLAAVLFAGRSVVPAAALIFRTNSAEAQTRVPVFSPLIANQEPTRPRTQGTRIDTWSIVIDENELRFLDRREIASGDALPWKMAAWGSELDRAIFRRTGVFPRLSALEEDGRLTMAEGMQLRPKPKTGGEAAEQHPELAGKWTIALGALHKSRLLFAFPKEALVRIDLDQTYVRVRGGFHSPERVSCPPHVLVNAARNWAIYSEEYIVVPARQIGIASSPHEVDLLKALTVYLNSDFVQHHQFFVSTQAGVKREVSTLRSLRTLPIPPALAEMGSASVRSWAALHDELAAHDVTSAPTLGRGARGEEKRKLLAKLNRLVNSALHLRAHDSIRVSEFVEVLMGLRNGKVEENSVRPPDEAEQRAYAGRLQHELNAFIGRDAGVSHAIDVWNFDGQGVIRIDLRAREAAVVVHDAAGGSAIGLQTVALRRHVEMQFPQWRYFNRNLRLFAEDSLYLFKPMQRFHWLESQAIQDAGEVVGLVLERAATPA